MLGRGVLPLASPGFFTTPQGWGQKPLNSHRGNLTKFLVGSRCLKETVEFIHKRINRGMDGPFCMGSGSMEVRAAQEWNMQQSVPDSGFAVGAGQNRVVPFHFRVHFRTTLSIPRTKPVEMLVGVLLDL